MSIKWIISLLSDCKNIFFKLVDELQSPLLSPLFHIIGPYHSHPSILLGAFLGFFFFSNFFILWLILWFFNLTNKRVQPIISLFFCYTMIYLIFHTLFFKSLLCALSFVPDSILLTRSKILLSTFLSVVDYLK